MTTPKHAAPLRVPDLQVPVHLGDLTGPEGNAFCVLGRVRQYFKETGMTTEEYEAFRVEAMSGDYDHLLDTVMRYCVDLDGSVQEYYDCRAMEDDD